MTPDLIAIISLLIAIVSFIDASLQRYKKKATAQYASERDFQHLRRNQEQIVSNVREVLDEFDEVKDEVRDVKRIIEVYLGLSGKLPYKPTRNDPE